MLPNAGQSLQTLSFFNTKQSNKDQTVFENFYQSIRKELMEQTDEIVLQLMKDYQPAKYSNKRNGLIAGYGANTNQGISRNYNEDRVAIILNILQPKQKIFNGVDWPKCSFFGVYDGHGGHIIKDDYFPSDPIQAIRNGFAEAEKLYLDFALGQEQNIGEIERSGSCATIVLVVDDICYVANTGDSRAVMSAYGGKQVITLSNDHKPTDEIEVDRILKNGGKIYQNASIIMQSQNTQVSLGPHRVFPGRLSVCRTFGDIEAKAQHLLGNPQVVIAEPDICSFHIDKKTHDFIILGCDGIFDKLDDKECVHLVWQNTINIPNFKNSYEIQNQQQNIGQRDYNTKLQYDHTLCGEAVDAILKCTAIRRSADNITVVFIAFDNFFNLVRESRGDVSKFEYSKIELSKIELLLPPSILQLKEDSEPMITYHNEISIIDQPFNNNSIFEENNYQNQGSLIASGSTGDHQYKKVKKLTNNAQSKQSQILDKEFRTSSRVQSERSLLKQREDYLQQLAVQQASNQNGLHNKNTLKKHKEFLNYTTSQFETIKSTGKLKLQPQKKEELNSCHSTSKLNKSSSMPKSTNDAKYTTAANYDFLSNTMPYQTQKQNLKDQNLLNLSSRRTTSTKTGNLNTKSQEQFIQQKSIKVEKPPSTKRKKTFEKPEISQQAAALSIKNQIQKFQNSVQNQIFFQAPSSKESSQVSFNANKVQVISGSYSRNNFLKQTYLSEPKVQAVKLIVEEKERNKMTGHQYYQQQAQTFQAEKKISSQKRNK